MDVICTNCPHAENDHLAPENLPGPCAVEDCTCTGLNATAEALSSAAADAQAQVDAAQVAAAVAESKTAATAYVAPPHAGVTVADTPEVESVTDANTEVVEPVSEPVAEPVAASTGQLPGLPYCPTCGQPLPNQPDNLF